MNSYDDTIPKDLPKNEIKATNGLIRKFSIISALGLMFILFLIIYSPRKPLRAHPPAQLPLPAAVPATRAQPNKDDFVLNGVFISDNYKSTLINNHFYQVGDTIKGMDIVSINYDKVILKHKAMRLELASIGNNHEE